MWASELCDTDLVEVLGRRPHLLPGLVQQLDADPEELLKCAVMGKEHRVVVIAALVGYGGGEAGRVRPGTCVHPSLKEQKQSKARASEERGTGLPLLPRLSPLCLALPSLRLSN